MSRFRVWMLLLLSFALGLAFGAGVVFWLLRSPAQGSPFLASLTLPEVSTQAGAVKWEVLEDDVRRHVHSTLLDDLVLPKRRTWAVSRYLAARATVPPQEQASVAKKFRAAVWQVLGKYGELSGPGGENGGNGTAEVGGRLVPWYSFRSHDSYLIDDTPGVLHIYLVGQEDSVTVFITLTEGG